jgi:hypothetical protein
MSNAQPEHRAEWKGRLVALLKPHLKHDEGERSGAIEAALSALEAAHGEGLREAASFCRQVATTAHRHGEVARALAEGIEAQAKQEDTDAADAGPARAGAD